jgi:hypothetical protein
MEKINPLLYITDTDPVPEVVLDASGWFETEYMEYNIDAYYGFTADYLQWFQAQGWVVYEQQDTGVVQHSGIGYHTAKVRLKRRKLQAERCLQSMITEFTNAYNEGRSINDSRYDELVQLYNVMLDKSETEMAATDAVASGYNTVIDSIIAKLGTDFTTHEGVVTGLLDDYGDSLRDEINTRFDNELSKAEQALVDRGMYNTTVWTSVSAGIETQRTKALTDLEDKIADKTLANQDRLHALRINMRNGMMDAHFKLLEKKQANAYKPLEFRNAIFKFMLDFMERRTDDYPGIDGLANIAAQLGFSEGAATVAPTAT